jgi:hypothetical protein
MFFKLKIFKNYLFIYLVSFCSRQISKENLKILQKSPDSTP